MQEIQKEILITGKWSNIANVNLEHAFIINEVYKKKIYGSLDITKGDIVLDIGAHIGIFTTWALEHQATKIIAVEPNPENVRLWKKNITSNCAQILDKAVTDKVGNAVLVIPAKSCRSSIEEEMVQKIYRKTKSGRPANLGWSSCQVNTVSLKELIHQFNPTKMKFDAEGAEYSTDFSDLGKIEKFVIELHHSSESMLNKARFLVANLENAGWQTTQYLPKNSKHFPTVTLFKYKR